MNSSSTPPRGDASAANRRHTTPARLARLCRKELREILRDRRTIVTLVVMPLLVYPLLSITFQKFFLQSFSPGQTVEYLIGYDDAVNQFEFERELRHGRQWLTWKRHSNQASSPDSESMPGVLAPESLVDEPQPQLQSRDDGDVLQLLAAGSIDLVILPGGAENDSSGSAAASDPRPSNAPRWRLLYRENQPLSRAAAQHIEELLNASNERHLYERLSQLGRVGGLPVSYKKESIQEPPSRMWVETMIPLILILMTITGAVYPAIDLTAGERERGTLETLMAAPVPRGELLLAKYVAVLTVALLTATANLAAMTITLSVGGFSSLLWGDGGLSPWLLVQVFGLTVLFASFFSAVVLALTSFARSFKEAQAYLIPLMLLCLTPGVISLMPGLKLNATLSIVPLVNIVLLSRDVLAGEATALPAIVSIVSTALYALAAIGIAARVFGSDAILYGSQSGWSDLFRRPELPRSAATLPAALFCLALMFPVTYISSGLLTNVAGQWLDLSIALSGLVTLLIYGSLPALFLLVQRVNPTQAFRAYAPRPRALIAAVLLGTALWPLAHEVFLIAQYMGLGGLDPQVQDLVKQMVARLRTVNPAVLLISYALIPALCEEWFFRGYLFSALTKTSGAIGAVVVSSLLFGAFHVVTAGVLATERFATTTALGFVLGVIAWRTGSVVPGIVVHVIHNTLMVSFVIYADRLSAWGWRVDSEDHLPVLWVVAAGCVTLAGFTLLFLSGPAVGRASRETRDRDARSHAREELKTPSG